MGLIWRITSATLDVALPPLPADVCPAVAVSLDTDPHDRRAAG